MVTNQDLIRGTESLIRFITFYWPDLATSIPPCRHAMPPERLGICSPTTMEKLEYQPKTDQGQTKMWKSFVTALCVSGHGGQ